MGLWPLNCSVPSVSNFDRSCKVFDRSELKYQFCLLLGIVLSFDVMIMYRYCPNGIDLYFENVGGEMLEAVLDTINVHGRIAVCGLISQVNVEEPAGPKNFKRVIYKRITIQGFLQSDYLHLKPPFMELMAKYLKEGQLEYIEDFAEGLDNAPAAFLKLLKGTNVGKQIITIAKQ